MRVFEIVFAIAVGIFIIGLLIYLFRGPGSSGYYRRGRRY